jgi:hypothetical protein
LKDAQVRMCWLTLVAVVYIEVGMEVLGIEVVERASRTSRFWGDRVLCI